MRSRPLTAPSCPGARETALRSDGAGTCEEPRPGPARRDRRGTPLRCGGRTPHPISSAAGCPYAPSFYKQRQPGEALSFPHAVRRDGGALDSRPPHRQMTRPPKQKIPR